MQLPKDLSYTKTHEWAKKNGNIIRVGITDYAQKEISDVVFVELPKVGQSVQQNKPIAVVESVKAAFDIYAPVSGKINKVNPELESNPVLVNDDCYGTGWFVEIETSAVQEWDQLLSADKYESHLKQTSH